MGKAHNVTYHPVLGLSDPPVKMVHQYSWKETLSWTGLLIKAMNQNVYLQNISQECHRKLLLFHMFFILSEWKISCCKISTKDLFYLGFVMGAVEVVLSRDVSLISICSISCFNC